MPEALNRKLLCPFQYFGISDGVDISRVSWTNGKYDVKELTKLYTGEKQRVGDIINNCEKYLTDIYDVRALGFCVSQKHASYMADISKNFLEFNHMERPQLYRRGSWKRLCADAGVIPDFSEPNEKEITRFLERRLPGCNSLSYLKFVKRLILVDFSPGSLSLEEELMLAMFHYDVWQKSGGSYIILNTASNIYGCKIQPRNPG